MIRSNLYAYLALARKMGCSDAIWIDAISINQLDYLEKSVQVRLMGEIYSLAASTVVWLNLPKSTMNQLYSLRQAIVNDSTASQTSDSKNFKRHIERWIESLQVAKTAIPTMGKLDRTDVNLLTRRFGLIDHFRDSNEALHRVIEDPYWTRAWIAQEILQSSCAQFLTPRGNLRYLDLLDMLKVFTGINEFYNIVYKAEADEGIRDLLWEQKRFVRDFGETETYLQRMQKFEELFTIYITDHKKGLSIDQALQLTVKSGCADPRDRVFSLRSLLLPKQQMIVDYTKRHDCLFYEIIEICVRSGMAGRVITDVAHMLFNALVVRPPLDGSWYEIEMFDNTNDLLESYTKHIPKNATWALMNNVRWYTDNDSVAPRLWRAYGLYTPIEIATNRWIILEFQIRTYNYLVESDNMHWLIERIESPRAWVLQTEKWEFCEGSNSGYQWGSYNSLISTTSRSKGGFISRFKHCVF